MATNLLVNAGFESSNNGDNPPIKWENFNSPTNVTRAVATDFAHSGTKSWKISTTDGNTADCGLIQREFSRAEGVITVTPNTTYTFTSWVKSALTTGQVHTHIKVFESGYGNEGGFDSPEITGTNDWTENKLTFKTRASDVIAEVWVCFGAYGGAANGTAWFDDFFLAEAAPVVSENISVTESVTVRLESSINKSESITVSENMARVLESSISKSENITLTESLNTLIPELHLSVSDSITITESVQRLLTSFITSNENITVSESVQIFKDVTDYDLSVSDSISLSESLHSELNSFIITHEDITLDEARGIILESLISVQEQIEVTENNLNQIDLNITVVDNISLSESVSSLISLLFIQISESITLTESSTVSPPVVDLKISKSDSITVTDSAGAGFFFYEIRPKPLIIVDGQIAYRLVGINFQGIPMYSRI